MATAADNINAVGDLTLLSNVVRQLIGDATATIGAWTQQPLQEGFSGFVVERFQGHAQTATGEQPWSLIRKIITPSGGSTAPEARDYWQRELLVYQSGLLADLTEGLAAPRCLAIDNPAGDEFRLWLEDIGTVDGSTWPLERYGLAARHFGRFFDLAGATAGSMVGWYGCGRTVGLGGGGHRRTAPVTAQPAFCRSIDR